MKILMVCIPNHVIEVAVRQCSPLQTVVPAHLALACLNEAVGYRRPGGGSEGGSNSLFATIIQKVGGDLVGLFLHWGGYIRY
jgi:hypothetical protein